MTLATLLLALLTATNPSSGGGASDPVLLDFHADWCGPCQQMRPAVDQLSRKGYPVKSINIDKAQAVADALRRPAPSRPSSWWTARAGSSTAPAASSPRPCWSGSTWPPRPRPSRPTSPTPMPCARDDPMPTPTSRPARPVRRARQERTRDRDDDDDRREPDDGRPATAFANPHPAQTVVRIKVVGPALDRLRLGDDHLQLARAVDHPDLRPHLQARGPGQGRCRRSEFPRQIVIDLFDGQLHSSPRGRRRSTIVESFPGRGDGLRLHAGRRADPSSGRAGSSRPAGSCRRTGSPRATPLPMKMLTVGCSEGNDATAWHTRIMNPRMKGFLQGQPVLRGDRVRVRAQAGAIRRRPVHDRRLHRGRLQLRRAAGQSRAVCDARGRSTPCSIATT